MSIPLGVKLILCDAASADGSGKLSMLGAGWSITGSPTAQQAVAVMIRIPWERANEKIPFSLQLLDPEGELVELATLEGTPIPLRQDGEIEVGRPPGLPAGTSLAASVALNVSPMPLAPGTYTWRLQIGDQTEVESFLVRG